MEGLLGGIVCGLIAWGGIRVEMRWLRVDVDKLDKRLTRLENVKA